MAQLLPEHGIDYRTFPALGGRRRRQTDIDRAINAGWQNDSFKNYAGGRTISG